MQQREDINARSKKRLKPNEGKSLDVLDSIQSQMKMDAKIRALQPKSALRKPDPNFVDMLAELMLNIPLAENKNISATPDSEEAIALHPSGTPDGGAKTELEMRIGIQENGKFTPGVKLADFDAYVKALQADTDLRCVHTDDLQYFYEISTGGNVRVTYDKENKRCVSSDFKQRLDNPQDMDLYCVPYACRFSLASEEARSVPPTLPDGYKLCRYKNRYSFSSKNGFWGWKVDLTEVKTRLANDLTQQQVHYEVEFEFEEEVIQICRNGDKAQVRATAVRFWDFVVKFLNHLYKSSGDSHFDGSLQLTKVTDEEAIRDLRETCASWIPSVSQENQMFPGSMPINLSKKHLSFIQQEKYFVSEKTDGIRAMLMILPLQGVYIIDRRFDFYTVPGFDSLLSIFATNGITLLDGEMITHIPSNKQMYSMFDLLALDGKIYATKPLLERLEQIGKGVVTVYREKVDSGEIPQDHPFILIGKQFLDKTEIQKLATSIKKDSQGRRFYIDSKRHHRTDGFIFTPAGPYQPWTCRTLFKWKYLDELSVDLKIHYDRGSHDITFSCAQGSSEDVDYPIKMKPEDKARLSRYMSTRRDPELIIECCFDSKEQMWKFKMIRTDKVRANNIRVVTDTVEVIAENLNTGELLQQFAPRRTTPQRS